MKDKTRCIGWAWKNRNGTFSAESCIYATPPTDKYADGGWVRVEFVEVVKNTKRPSCARAGRGA